jgi:hypothetical protein
VEEDRVQVSVVAPVAAPTVNGQVAAQGLSRLHSRNSSDSSGYHEAEVTLSGAESPEAAPRASLPGGTTATFKTSIDTTSIDSGDHPNGDSGIQEEHVDRPSKPVPSSKKKKAPPPPPKAKGTVLRLTFLFCTNQF